MGNEIITLARYAVFMPVSSFCLPAGAAEGRRAFPICFLILLALAAIAEPASARAQDCSAYIEPSVTVVPIYAPLRYDHAHSLSQIQQLAGHAKKIDRGGSREISIGLTASSMSFVSSYSVIMSSELSSPMVCGQISRFELQFGFDDTLIYLARELPYPSCGYDSVLNHEMRHVDVDRRLMSSYLPQLSALVGQRLRAIGVVRAGSADGAEDVIKREVDAYLQELETAISSVREVQQEEVDTREEYLRISQSCRGEVARLAHYEENEAW
ncbi:MAG: hypothetical protein HGA90_03550 [Alphaproteobacteria bacterium]|nr:hypothetical protein [Alphaproteobacteria bacterium]